MIALSLVLIGVPLYTMNRELNFVSLVRDPGLLDRKASLLVRTSLILFDFVLPDFLQVMLDLFLGSEKIGFDKVVFVATAFLVENFKRFTLWKQTLVDRVATTGPHSCFHLVKVLIGRNMVHIGRIAARFSYFGHFSP